mgnify:FL=1|tara:strand:- start:233 stop:451 length:219 start_codon:yes stop_codon:yes gene_type:complete
MQTPMEVWSKIPIYQLKKRLKEELDIDISTTAIYKWKYKRSIPAERCIQINQLYDIPLEELRPDLFGFNKYS